MLHMAGHFVALANVPNTNVNAIADPVLTIQNNQYLAPADWQIFAAFFGSDQLQSVRLNTPYMRRVNPPVFSPIQLAESPGSPPAICDLRKSPIYLKNAESIAIEATSTNAGPNNCYAVLLCGDNIEPAPSGDIFPLILTSTTAAVASAWTTLASTFPTTLPTGKYAVVGLRHFSATGIACRIVFPGVGYSPGTFSQTSIGDVPWYGQIRGGLGVLGYFTNTTLPNFQVLCDAADATHTIILEVIKV